MPLIHSGSKKAMGKNIKAEMHAGKPQKQAIAIAYDIQRRNKKAYGGMVDEKGMEQNRIAADMPGYAKGGLVGPKGMDHKHMAEEHPGYAEGGLVSPKGMDHDHFASEHPGYAHGGRVNRLRKMMGFGGNVSDYHDEIDEEMAPAMEDQEMADKHNDAFLSDEGDSEHADHLADGGMVSDSNNPELKRKERLKGIFSEMRVKSMGKR